MAVACHEFGHTVGLAHRSSSTSTYGCMNINFFDHLVRPHNVAHVEDLY